MKNLWNRTKYIWVGILSAASLVSLAGGCEKRDGWGVMNGASCEEQLKLYMPMKIDILPFTKPRSWDEDQIPDGLEVVLRPLDSFGDQTKAIGCFRFEVYTFAKADSNPRGKRVGFWEENLTTRDAQALHWDKITRTYRFRLAWNDEASKIRQGKYVRDVTFLAPNGLRLTDTYIMEARLPKEAYKENIENKQKGLKLF